MTNGWLTGRDIVTYDEDAIAGARIAYAPVEDLLFGFSLVVQTLAWWVWWGWRLSRPRPGLDGGPDVPGAGRAQPPATGSRRAP